MKHYLVASCIITAIGCYGCAQLGLTGNPANDVPVVSQDILKVTSAACKEFQPVAQAASVAPDKRVQVIAGTVAGMCDPTTGDIVPSAIAKVDPSTAAWIGMSVGMLKALGVQPAQVKA